MPHMEKDKQIIQTFGIPQDIDLCSFNCLGFATGIFTWLPKGDLERKPDALLIHDVIRQINALSPGRIRIIEREEDLRGKEYLCIVFLESEKDFLHAVRKEGDRWVEKNGHEVVSYLPDGIDPLKDNNCSWSKLREVCTRPHRYMLAVDPEASVKNYEYMSDSPVSCYLKMNLICEALEIYDLPLGIKFYETEEEARQYILGEGKYLWKLTLENIDKPIRPAEGEQGILFNDEAYMIEILNVQKEDSYTYQILAKPVLMEDIAFEETVTIPLEKELRDYLPKQYSPVSAFL